MSSAYYVASIVISKYNHSLEATGETAESLELPC